VIAVARLAILVGIAGLIPFLAGTAGLFAMPEKSIIILSWFYAYSAGILAFMAGIYWTIALQLEPPHLDPTSAAAGAIARLDQRGVDARGLQADG